MRVWKFAANVDTDALAPGAYMQFGLDVLAKHCLKRLRPEFADQVAKGDVIVAGPGFGIGSSREQAAAVLVKLGVAAVIAPSFGGLFFRNAFNLGLLALVCPRAQEIQDTDSLVLLPEQNHLIRRAELSAENTRAEVKLPLEPTPDFLLNMARVGGLLEVLKQRKQSSPQHA